MAVTITAELAGVADPQVVQVVVDGLTVGTEVSVRGTIASGKSWTVRGSAKTADSTQLVVVDDLAAINTPITYSVLVDGVTAATAGSAVTVAFAADIFIASIDLATVVTPTLQANGLPIEIAANQHFTLVPGRQNPVLRFAAGGNRAGRWLLRFADADAEEFAALVGAGAPLVLRSDGAQRDLPPSRIVAVTAAPSSLWGVGATETDRLFDVSWVGLDDPYADTVISGDSFLDVDNGYAGDDFEALDAAYSGSSFGDFNRTDWAGLGA